MNVVERLILERDLRARASVSRTFASLGRAEEAPRVQAALFDVAPHVDAAPRCSHVGKGRVEQLTLSGATETLCASCYAALSPFSHLAIQPSRS